MSQSQFDALVQSLDLSTIRLRPGQVIIDQDPLPAKDGSLFLPQRDVQPDHPANTGTVLAIGTGPFKYADGSKTKTYWPPDIKVGDRVVYRLLLSDLNRKRVFTDVRRIDAVIEYSLSELLDRAIQIMSTYHEHLLSRRIDAVIED